MKKILHNVPTASNPWTVNIYLKSLEHLYSITGNYQISEILLTSKNPQRSRRNQTSPRRIRLRQQPELRTDLIQQFTPPIFNQIAAHATRLHQQPADAYLAVVHYSYPSCRAQKSPVDAPELVPGEQPRPWWGPQDAGGCFTAVWG